MVSQPYYLCERHDHWSINQKSNLLCSPVYVWSIWIWFVDLLQNNCVSVSCLQNWTNLCISESNDNKNGKYLIQRNNNRIWKKWEQKLDKTFYRERMNGNSIFKIDHCNRVKYLWKLEVKYQNMFWKFYQAMCSRYDRYKYINGVQIENSIDYVIIKWGTQQVINNNE